MITRIDGKRAAGELQPAPRPGVKFARAIFAAAELVLPALNSCREYGIGARIANGVSDYVGTGLAAEVSFAPCTYANHHG